MQNFARNSALAKILGLAKMHNFAKIAKFPGIADLSLLCLLSSTALIFLHFAFILSLIFGLIDG